MGIKLVKKTTEATKQPVTLKITNGRVKGLTYEMAKALIDEDVSVFVEDTGPFGEDEKAEIISYNPKSDLVDGEIDLGGGDVSTIEDVSDPIIIDREFGQSGCNWADFSDLDDYIYILAGDLSKAAAKWAAAGLI